MPIFRQIFGSLNLSILIVLAAFTPARGSVIVDLDAANLKRGDLISCKADGSAALSFTAGGADTIAVGMVAGRRAVNFAGGDWLTSSFPAPPDLTGNHAFTVAVWAYNQQVGGEEAMVQWARRGTDARSAQFNYGTAPVNGAVTHWGDGDMGYTGGAPSSNKWHHLALTYTGGKDGTERVYVDGKVVATATKSLDLWPGGPINIGHALGGQDFTGALASVQMFAAALPEAAIAALAQGQSVTQEAVVDLDASRIVDGPLITWSNRGGAMGTFRRASIPRVKLVANRPAIVFDGVEHLVSDKELPALPDDSPFTLEAWVFNPEPGGSEPYAALVAPKQWPLQFQFGKSPIDGAFGSEHGSAAFNSQPSANMWHHLAIACSGNGATLTLFVDGELDSNRPLKAALPPAANLWLGGDGRRGFTGALARLRIHDTELSQSELRRANDMTGPYEPNPRNGAIVATLTPNLTWTPGTDEAKSFIVYFDKTGGKPTDDEVGKKPKHYGADRVTTRLPLQHRTQQTSFTTPKLEIGATYAWSLSQFDTAGNPILGALGTRWSFTVDDGSARNPAPCNQTSNTAADLTDLTWTPGPFATKQHLFFGTSKNEVANATKPAVADLTGDTKTCQPPSALQPGTRYYWRVDCENGDQPPTKGPLWEFRTRDRLVPDDVTFFVISDTHYTPDPASFEAVRFTIDAMNRLPGTPYPGAIGGYVETPRGVLVTGDLIDNGAAPWAAAVWDVFTKDFGVNGEGRVCYPVYEIVGNHDTGDGNPPQEGVRARNRSRAGLTGVSANGLHYSWNWDNLHMVALNKFSGSGPDPARKFNQSWNDPTGSLGFLTQDLRRNASARPVILFQHYGFDDFSAGWGWWSETDRKATWGAIRDFNVIAYLHGHTHAMTFMKWQGEDIHLEGKPMPAEGIDVIGCASGQRGPSQAGEFMVIHVTAKDMTVAHRFVKRWGEARRIPLPSAPRWPNKKPGLQPPDKP